MIVKLQAIHIPLLLHQILSKYSKRYGILCPRDIALAKLQSTLSARCRCLRPRVSSPSCRKGHVMNRIILFDLIHYF